MDDIERARLENILEQQCEGLVKIVRGTFQSIRSRIPCPTVPAADREHQLKCWPEYFSGLWAGLKRAELRKTDRDFCVGDTVLLLEYLPGGVPSQFTGRWVRARIIRIDEFREARGLALLSLDFIGRGSHHGIERHPGALAPEVAQTRHGADLGRVTE